jgi:hypothetical protein
LLQAEAARARDVASQHKKWVAGRYRLADELNAAGVEPTSAKLMAKAFGDMN